MIWHILKCIYIYIMVTYVCMYVCMYVRMYACTYVCMYVCMHVYICVCVCTNVHKQTTILKYWGGSGWRLESFHLFVDIYIYIIWSVINIVKNNIKPSENFKPSNNLGKPQSGCDIQRQGCGKPMRRLWLRHILLESQCRCHKRKRTEALGPWQRMSRNETTPQEKTSRNCKEKGHKIQRLWGMKLPIGYWSK